ncbi:hypothetical protein SK128_022760 [Halocaridina rubra]|uniref:DUF4371 domain-containing protein n=1 Tax=Halocaridina rubra TaxID=373956 RepID=A0AAN8WSB7_HALRR
MFGEPIMVKNATSKAEILAAAMAVEHHLSYTLMDHMPMVFPRKFPDSVIAKAYASKRTKSAALVDNVLAIHFREDLLKNFRDTQYLSFIMDETADISTESVMAIVLSHNNSSCCQGLQSAVYLDSQLLHQAINFGSPNAAAN